MLPARVRVVVDPGVAPAPQQAFVRLLRPRRVVLTRRDVRSPGDECRRLDVVEERRRAIRELHSELRARARAEVVCDVLRVVVEDAWIRAWVHRCVVVVDKTLSWRRLRAIELVHRALGHAPS